MPRPLIRPPECNYGIRAEMAGSSDTRHSVSLWIVLLGQVGDEDNVAGRAVARKHNLLAIG
jgi:hypothetical protein